MNTKTDRLAIPFTVSSVFFMLAAVAKVFNLAVLRRCFRNAYPFVGCISYC